MHLALEFKAANLGYGSKTVVTDLDLQLFPGEFCSILGSSGSGKSTLLKTVAGFLPLQQGQLYLEGQDANSLPPEKRSAPLLFQDLRLFPHLNVIDNLSFPLKMQGKSKAERYAKAEQLLQDVGLSGYAKRPIDQLSGGEQQRVALARAVIAAPRFLLLDEAFSSLDLALRQNMRALLRDLQAAYGFTCLFVSHNLQDALLLSDKILILDRGRVIFNGSPKELVSQKPSDPAYPYLKPWLDEQEASQKSWQR
jgi:ABC-type Fe3+/spermidine/putrescine transport system ATPase subunit